MKAEWVRDRNVLERIQAFSQIHFYDEKQVIDMKQKESHDGALFLSESTIVMAGGVYEQTV